MCALVKKTALGYRQKEKDEEVKTKASHIGNSALSGIWTTASFYRPLSLFGC